MKLIVGNKLKKVIKGVIRMDVEFWNLLFKIALITLLSFFIPFVFSAFVLVTTSIEVGQETSKKEWVSISLISLLIMTVSLLIFGIYITK